jgi:hypothetical protein
MSQSLLPVGLVIYFLPDQHQPFATFHLAIGANQQL